MFEVFGEDGVLKKFDILDEEGLSAGGPGNGLFVFGLIQDFEGLFDEVADRL